MPSKLENIHKLEPLEKKDKEFFMVLRKMYSTTLIKIATSFVKLTYFNILKESPCNYKA